MIGAHAAAVLIKAHIQDPMLAVLDPPMPADVARISRRVGCLAADVVPDLHAGLFACLLPLAIDQRDRLEVLPQRLVANPFGVLNRVGVVGLHPPVPLIDFLVVTLLPPL